MRLHVAQVREQCIGKGGAVRKSAKARELLELLRPGWQNMGLLIGDHLQSIFYGTQKAIRGGNLLVRLRVDPASLLESLQCRQRRLHAQLGMPPAGDELL